MKETQDAPRTKLEKIMFERGIKQYELLDMINKKCPEDPISVVALNKVVTGKNNDRYGTFTLLRICYTLDITPNEVLDYEKDFKSFIEGEF